MVQNRIAEYRRKRGLTQEQLAKAIGKTRSTIAMYEASANEPPVRVLWDLAKVLKVPWTKLVIVEDAPVGVRE